MCVCVCVCGDGGREGDLRRGRGRQRNWTLIIAEFVTSVECFDSVLGRGGGGGWRWDGRWKEFKRRVDDYCEICNRSMSNRGEDGG